MIYRRTPSNPKSFPVTGEQLPAIKKASNKAHRQTRNEDGSPIRLLCSNMTPKGQPRARTVRDWSTQSQVVNRNRRGGWKTKQVVMGTDGMVYPDEKITCIKTSSEDGKVYGKYGKQRVVRLGYMSDCWKIIG